MRVLLLACGALAAGFAAPLFGQDPVLRVIAMPTRSEAAAQGFDQGLVVDGDLLREFRRLANQAVSEGAGILVFEITTPGGDLAVYREIRERLADLRAQGIRTVAFVPEDATSAGALLALACHEIVMVPGAAIGNAIPRIVEPTGRIRDPHPKEMTEVLAEAEKLALGGPFHPLIVRAMVDPDCEVVAVYPDGQDPELLLAEDFRRAYGDRAARLRTWHFKSHGVALKLVAGGNTVGLPGFPHLVAEGRDDLRRALGLAPRALEGAELLRIPVPRRGLPLLPFLDPTLLLLLLAVVFFVLEMKTPGVGIFSVLGVASLFLYFALAAGEGASIALSLGLVVAGILLLGIEIFVTPGFGVFGIGGILMVLFAIYSATIELPGSTFFERTIPDSSEDFDLLQRWVLRLFATVTAGVVGALLLVPRLHRLPFLARLSLATPLGRASAPARAGPGAAHEASLKPGEVGRAETVLRPAGKVRFAGRAFDVQSEGPWIEAGTEVRVVRVEGPRVFVAPVTRAP